MSVRTYLCVDSQEDRDGGGSDSFMKEGSQMAGARGGRVEIQQMCAVD